MYRAGKRIALLSVLAFGLATGTPALAGAPKFDLSPHHPYVDDAVTISWRTTRALPKGERYEGFLTDEPGVNCASLVFSHGRAGIRKGSIARLNFSPYHDALDGGPRWCLGKAGITIEIAKIGTKRARIIGLYDFRFYREP